MIKVFTINEPKDFGVVIKEVLEVVSGTTVVLALQGDLGAGKTAFTQELAKYLGVAEPVTSPTFTIMKQYELNQELFDRLIHIDAYRFEDESEAVPLRLSEVFTAPRTIVCVEWPELIRSIVPPTAIWVHLSIIEGNTREVTITTPENKLSE